jgi:hypothetical protein
VLGDIGHLSPIVHLLSKHGRYGRFQPCPDGRFSFPPHPSPLPSGERGRVRGKLEKGLGDSNFQLCLIDLFKKVKVRDYRDYETIPAIRNIELL